MPIAAVVEAGERRRVSHCSDRAVADVGPGCQRATRLRTVKSGRRTGRGSGGRQADAIREVALSEAEAAFHHAGIAELSAGQARDALAALSSETKESVTASRRKAGGGDAGYRYERMAAAPKGDDGGQA